MGTYRFVSHTRLSPTRALSLWVNLGRVTEWIEGVTAVTDVSGGPDRPEFTLPGDTVPSVLMPGSRYTLWFGRRFILLRVLEHSGSGAVAAHRAEVSGSFWRGEMIVMFEPEPDGSRVTLDIRAHGLLSRAVARVLATGFYRRSYRSQLHSFSRLAEREHWRYLTI